MSNFAGIERRIKDECRTVGARKSDQLFITVGKALGYNPGSTWWAPEEFLAAIKPLRAFAANRFSDMEFSRVWNEAEKAALEVLKRGDTQ